MSNVMWYIKRGLCETSSGVVWRVVCIPVSYYFPLARIVSPMHKSPLLAHNISMDKILAQLLYYTSDDGHSAAACQCTRDIGT